jgi:integrating conjugative element protein (TIGR03765 family)
MAEGLAVIYDSGRAVPAAPYLAYLVSDPYATDTEVMPGLKFPLVSRLQPGLLDREHQVFDPQWLAQPVFLAGADARSLRWLTFNRLRLWRAGAWGLVVQAENAGQFRAIQSIAPELKFAPAMGDWLGQHLIAQGVAVYPLLIGLDGVARQILSDDVDGPSGIAFDAPVRPMRPPEDRP